jgi:hypothetical protein
VRGVSRRRVEVEVEDDLLLELKLLVVIMMCGRGEECLYDDDGVGMDSGEEVVGIFEVIIACVF